MFVGRKKYLADLSQQIAKPSAAILVYGKRRVGKSTLIKESYKNSPKTKIYFECIKDTLAVNCSLFVDELKRLKLINYNVQFNNFIDVFVFLNDQKKSFIIVIDEYPYLKEFNGAKKVDSIFQSIIDQRLKNIVLFISGSHVSIMKELLEHKNALYSRFTYIVELFELNYLETAEFYPKLSNYDKTGFYAVFGGSPFVNQLIDPKQSLKENIINLLLNPNSSVFQYVDSLLISDLSSTANAKRLLACLKNGKKRYNELESILDKNRTGNLSKMLKPLLAMNLISKVYPINAEKNEKKVFYETNDNIVRFYYAFIYENLSAFNVLTPKDFYQSHVEPSLTTFIAHRFENIVRQYIAYNFSNISNVGTYFYNDSVNHKNGEFDVAISDGKNYDLIEVKYHEKPLEEKELQNEIKQIMSIPNIKIKNVGFASISGFAKNVRKYQYLITGDDIYSK